MRTALSRECIRSSKRSTSVLMKEDKQRGIREYPLAVVMCRTDHITRQCPSNLPTMHGGGGVHHDHQLQAPALSSTRRRPWVPLYDI